MLGVRPRFLAGESGKGGQQVAVQGLIRARYAQQQGPGLALAARQEKPGAAAGRPGGTVEVSREECGWRQGPGEALGRKDRGR